MTSDRTLGDVMAEQAARAAQRRDTESGIRQQVEAAILPLTVGALKQLLEGLDDSRVVYSDGCDCVDVASGIYLDPDGVTIERRHNRILAEVGRRMKELEA